MPPELNEMFSGRELAEIQNRVEDLSCLPSVRVEDLNRNIEPTVTENITRGKQTVFSLQYK